MLASQQQAVPGGTGSAVELSAVAITSDPVGAEVEIDKVFMGSTPIQAKLAPGLGWLKGLGEWLRTLAKQNDLYANRRPFQIVASVAVALIVPFRGLKPSPSGEGQGR